MTNEAIGLVNREVGSLDDLGVAGGTSEFHPPPQLAQMFSMGKGHILIDHIPLKVFDFMASLLEATRIVDLRMRLVWPFSGDKVGQRYLTIHPLPFHMVEKTRLIMAFRTCNIPVAGGPPGFHIGIHLMADTAKEGTLRKPEQPYNNKKKSDDGDGEEDLYSSEMSPCSFLRLFEKIDPEGLHQIIKIFESLHVLESVHRVPTA